MKLGLELKAETMEECSWLLVYNPDSDAHGRLGLLS